MERVVLVRHAESVFSARRLANGDPAACGGLTDKGRRQARLLGRVLADEPIDLAVTTGFRRTEETADLALAGRSIPRLVVAELAEIRVGSFEGRSIDEYSVWAWSAPPGEVCPGDGESRAAAAARFARGLRVLLARPERVALVVGHALVVRYVLDAAAGLAPAARMAPVEHAAPFPLRADEVEAAAGLLERWSAAPRFRDPSDGGRAAT